MKLAIVGTGYVGLVSGTCFAEMGNDVICVDIDVNKVESLSNGQLTIFEPGLKVYFERNLREKRLHFTTNLEEAVSNSDVVFLALPTPPGEDGSADLSYVLGVAAKIGPMLKDLPYKVIVNKSTVPVGTADKVAAKMVESGAVRGDDFDVVSNPEFLKEGVAVDDFMKPERVVIGASSEAAAEIMTKLYEPFVRNNNPIILTDERSAEMIKYAANAFLATKISFMNEVANVCDAVGANVDLVRRGMGTDTRIGSKFLYPGIGFGGSCFPKDVQALAQTARKNEYDFEILEAVLRVNARQQSALIPRILERFEGDVKGKKFGMWGLSFKPNTDDVREASSHVMIRHLLEAGAEIVAFDPEARETSRAVFGDAITYVDDAYDALTDAEALIICTEWNEFRRPDFGRVKSLLKAPIIFDGRNLYRPERVALEGFEYFSIGRPYLEPVTIPDSAKELIRSNGLV